MRQSIYQFFPHELKEFQHNSEGSLYFPTSRMLESI